MKYFKKIFKPEYKKSGYFLEELSHASGELYPRKAEPSVYARNAVVYRCVNLIAQSASHVPWTISGRYGGAFNITDDHPAYRLLKRPSAQKSGAEFFCELISDKLLFGISYILCPSSEGRAPSEMYILNPGEVGIEVSGGIPMAYRYKKGSAERRYAINRLNGLSDILPIKSYSPGSDIYGISSLEAASGAIEIHNSTTRWNSSLLKNGARPSGALIVEENGGYLTEEQFDRLREQVDEKFSGAAKAGRPLVLEGRMKWQEMGVSPKDMDFLESKNSAAREIALAFGVPPQLLGIAGDSTYSNMQEARLALWEETLIPLLDKISDALSPWLSYKYGEEIIIDFDRDKISALTEKRQNLWEKIDKAGFMTVNEKRAFVGLKPIGGGDSL